MHKGQIAVQIAEWGNLPSARARHTTRRTAKLTAKLTAAMLCALLAAFVSVNLARADAPVTSLRIYPQPLRDYSGAGAETVTAAAVSEENGEPRKFIIDTDPGVDDAAALAWALLAHEGYNVEILGIVATAGNANIESATHNALLIRHVADTIDIPVFMGESAPLVQQLSSTGKLVHGPDGLWGVGTFYPNQPDVSDPPPSAVRFYCSVGQNDPGATIVTLGPLTGVARALQVCPSHMANFTEIFALGGAKFGGNATPVAEFNVWQDPEAAEIVLASGIPVTLVPLDAFTALQFDFIDVLILASSGAPLAELLACPGGICTLVDFQAIAQSLGYRNFTQLMRKIEQLKRLKKVQDSNGLRPLKPVEELAAINQGLALSPLAQSPLGIYLGTQLGAVGEASIPDLAAVMYAFDRTLPVLTVDQLDSSATLGSPLVEVMLEPELVRGQTVIGISFPEKLTMILDDQELSQMIDRAIAADAFEQLFEVLAGIVIQSSLASNVNIVLSIDDAVEEMRERFLDELTNQPAVAGIVAESSANANPDTFVGPEPQIFVPTVTGTD